MAGVVDRVSAGRGEGLGLHHVASRGVDKTGNISRLRYDYRNTAPCVPFEQGCMEEVAMLFRTLTGYGIGVVIVFAILNGIAWLIKTPWLHRLNDFSAGFVLGMVGMDIAAYLYGYRQVT